MLLFLSIVFDCFTSFIFLKWLYYDIKSCYILYCIKHNIYFGGCERPPSLKKKFNNILIYCINSDMQQINFT